MNIQVYGGMRGMKGLVYETSVLDPDEVCKVNHNEKDCASLYPKYFVCVHLYDSSAV